VELKTFGAKPNFVGSRLKEMRVPDASFGGGVDMEGM
jgi:hypothetical protein